MPGTIFASDLDNTLLFSWKHAVEGDLCVEFLNGAPQGYLTGEAPSYLERIMRHALFVPVTSRSVEQYLRIQFPHRCRPRYAVAANGALLLIDGKIDPAWREEFTQAVAPWQDALQAALAALSALPQGKRCRIVDGMFAFAACDNPQDALALSGALEDVTPLQVSVTGRKVYLFPPPVNKGAAVQKLRRRLQADRVICAGDSVIDIPMLQQADVAILPDAALLEGAQSSAQVVCAPPGRFYDFVLQEALRRVSPQPCPNQTG